MREIKTDKMLGVGVLAACLMGMAMVAPAAKAKLLHATLTASGDFQDTFTIESDAGVPVPGNPDAIFFPITNDGAGFTAAIFHDLNDSATGAFGTGTSPADFSLAFGDTFLPPLYDGMPAASFNLAPGRYEGFLFDSVLTLAVPEPATWSLMIAGAAAIGVLLVGRRRRRWAAA
jgi:PEP-CTERM motif